MKDKEKRPDAIPVVGHAKRRAYAIANAYLENRMSRILDEHANGLKRRIPEVHKAIW